MKKLIFPMLIAAFSFWACSDAPESDEAQVGEAKEEKDVAEAVSFTIDKNESNLEWIGTKTTGRHHGTFDFKSGSVEVKNDKVVGGEFVFDITSLTVLDEDLPEDKKGKLRGHLLSGDFFKAEDFPTATFVITDVKATNKTIQEETDPKQKEINKYKVSNPTHTVTGNLKLRDSTKSVSFPAKVEVTDGKVTTVAKFNINRKDWGMNWEYPPGEAVLNNTVHVGINVVATNSQVAKK